MVVARLKVITVIKTHAVDAGCTHLEFRPESRTTITAKSPRITTATICRNIVSLWLTLLQSNTVERHNVGTVARRTTDRLAIRTMAEYLQ